jgi:hypothetical protein
MTDFERAHSEQLKNLKIPPPLYDPLDKQLRRCFVLSEDGGIDLQLLVDGCTQNVSELSEESLGYGSMLVFPHVCSWDVVNQPSRGLFDSLKKLPIALLQKILIGLKESWGDDSPDTVEEDDSKNALLNRICDARIWSRIILFYSHSDRRVKAALPAPPYLPQIELESETDTTEADATGPFPFQYHMPLTNGEEQVIDISLIYVSQCFQGRLPTIDVAPSYSVPNTLTRCVRYAALLSNQAPAFSLAKAKEIHANFVHNMHLVRQKKLSSDEIDEQPPKATTVPEPMPVSTTANKTVWKVYTDSNDPMELSHPEAGLASSAFELTQDPAEADIIYSFKSLFGPGEMQQLLDKRPNTLINQFPFEGAIVQKDHLCREILKQHGLPRPDWSIETYDLDVQLGEFVGGALLAAERGEKPLWIIKPARGTQSQGHVVTHSTAQVLKLIDAGGESRVAQRYIVSALFSRPSRCGLLSYILTSNVQRKTLFAIRGGRWIVDALS